LLQEAAQKLNDRVGPRLALAMAQFRSGRAIEARKTLAAAVRAYDWTEPRAAQHADPSTIWVSHVLRREAEVMILPNLDAFLKGNCQPQDNDERLALLGICQSQGRFGTAARLYADAFAADPGLADSLTRECVGRAVELYVANHDPAAAFNVACRYHAARCAAVAGCGLGENRDKLSEAQRTRWRKQAKEWLEADLPIWTAKLNTDSPVERNLARRILTSWLADPGLAGIRELEALDELSANERKDCLALWRDVRVALKSNAQNRSTAALDPKRTDSQGASPAVLMQLGLLKEARVTWQKALEAEPIAHDAWYGYAELCLFFGDEDGYRRARQDLLERFGAATDPYVAERTGRACLLMPATGADLRRAVALAERATASNSGDQVARPYFVFVRGLAEYRQGQFDRAVSAMRGDAARVLGPAPGLVVAMALHQKGQLDQARHALASTVLSFDWRANQVHDQHGCIAHALRREAEAMILPNLPAFLEGKYRPQNNDERLALLGVCQFTNRTCAAARLYADAFANDPRLAEDLGASHRFNAARVAALAGCGVGLDGAKLTTAERAPWRRHVRDWLRADLAASGKLLETKTGASRDLARKTLANWKSEPGLTGLRDSTAMDAIAQDERNEWLALWQAVEDVLTRARGAT
jgi:tetratricopeptide (TPR) repeat protein